MNLIYILILFFAFLTVETKNLKASIISLILHSIFLTFSVFSVGYINSISSFYLIGFLDLLVRVFLIPLILFRSLKNRATTETKPYISYPLSIALSIVILSVFYHLLEVYKSLSLPQLLESFSCGVTLFIYGLYPLISKKDLIKIVISFVIIENGIHIFLISILPYLSKFIEISLTFNYLVAIFFFAYIVFKINEISLKEELQKLKETVYKETNE
ncbi:MAG: hypothetical protein NZ809_04610 [Thermodesulfovibrio sp.]|nr:hypothetical protein [Thermodesulfovibrio sp.]